MAWAKIDNIKGPQGDKGPAGTIGSVSAETAPAGSPARATITGTEDVHLHLELPKGEKGDRGPAGVASSAAAEAVPYGKPAEAILEQYGESVHLKLKIPGGAPGPDAVPTAEVIGANLSAPESPARPGLESGMDQVAKDPTSAFAVEQKAKLDAGLAGKANLVDGKVPDAELGVSQAATAGTIPKRGAGGTIPGVGAPAAAGDAANRSYVDGTVTATVGPVSAQVDAIETVMVTTDDLLVTAAIQGAQLAASVSSEPNFSHYTPFFVAPFPMRILSAQVVFYRAQTTPTSTNYAGVALRRFRAGVGGQIVEKSTFADPPQAQTAWSLDGATWNESNRVLKAGDSVAFGASVNGSYDVKYPVAITIKFARVVA